MVAHWLWQFELVRDTVVLCYKGIQANSAMPKNSDWTPSPLWGSEALQRTPKGQRVGVGGRASRPV